jgi:hypothetical protein
MVQEIKNITDIYLNLFKKYKEPIYKFIHSDCIEKDIIEDYEENLKILKLIAEDCDSIFQVNSFFNLPSIALLAGKPKLLAKIDDEINLSYYELINYIDDIELLLYENSKNILFKCNISVDLLFINNYIKKNNSDSFYDIIFNNIKPEKFIIIEGIDDYFFNKIDYLLNINEWKIYYLNKKKFDFIVLKSNIIK